MTTGNHQPPPSAQDDAIRYMDGSSLSRPLDMPRSQNRILLGFVAAAVILGAIMMFYLLDMVFNAPARNAVSVESNINRTVTYNVPVLTTLTGQSGDIILNAFTAAGYAVIQMPNSTQTATNFDVFKLPSDVSVADATVDYSLGINNLSASEAARLLTGSWRMTLDNSAGNDLSVKYADFSSKSLDVAIQTAMDQQGLPAAAVTDSGIDSAGNTFKSGSIDVGGTRYSWKVSACSLSGVYPINGLPSSALYVGIRLYR